MEKRYMDASARPCLISCGILRKEIEKLVEDAELRVNAHFLSEKLHYDPNKLNSALNGAIHKFSKNCPEGIIVVYGDYCTGFNDEMKSLIDTHNVVKVDALNCIDCLLGGKGKLREVDPDYEYFFLTPGFIHFSESIKSQTKEETRQMFGMLKGIILLDSLGNLEENKPEIDTFCDQTGLDILETRHVGLEGLKKVIQEAIEQAG
jgi:hypothetical protein